MSQSEEISLLGFVDTPILVGDPDGCIVYANPSFRRYFGVDGDELIGQPLAMVFSGGAREVVLSVTASVLAGGEPARVRLREDGLGFTGLASPIEAEDDRVGVIMVLLEEDSKDDGFSRLIDDASLPLQASFKKLEALSTPILARVPEAQREAYTEALAGLEDARNALRELQLVARGGRAKQNRFDLSNSVQRVADRVTRDADDELDLEVILPPNLPRVEGMGASFERILINLVQQRIEESKAGHPLTILARESDEANRASVLVSLVDVPDPALRTGSGRPPEALQQGIENMGGETICVEDSMLGRVTSMRLTVPSS